MNLIHHTSLPLKKRKIHLDFSYETSLRQHNSQETICFHNEKLHSQFSISSAADLISDSIHDLSVSSCAMSKPQESTSFSLSDIYETQTPNHPKKYCPWYSKFWELVEFRTKTGHCNVPQKYSTNPSLGKWVHKQRQDFKKLKSDPKPEHMEKRLKALLEIGFEFTTNNRAEALWHQRFKDLQQFNRMEGHCDVPQAYELNLRLGKWVRRQRHEYTKMLKGESSAITVHRIEALNAIGFKWSIRKTRKDRC